MGRAEGVLWNWEFAVWDCVETMGLEEGGKEGNSVNGFWRTLHLMLLFWNA